MLKTNLLKYFGILVLAALLTFLIFISVPQNDIVVENQPKGRALHIRKASFAKGGFAVVLGLNPASSLPDDTIVLNNPVYMPVGIYKDFDLRLKDEATLESDRVVVALYEDKDGEPGYFEALSQDGKPLDVPLYFWYGKVARKIINVY